MNTQHLSDTELDEVLIGDAPGPSLAHLAACPACSARLTALRAPIASFRSVSLFWAAERAAFHDHLSDEQLDMVLMDDAPAPAAAAHLAGCAPCRGRLAAVADPIAGFQAVSVSWSERRSATLPLRPVEVSRPGVARRYGWAGAMAAGVAVAVAVAAHHQEAGLNMAQATVPAQAGTSAAGSRIAPPAQVRQVAAVPVHVAATEIVRQQQIEADNRMLAGIDRELDTSQQTLAQFGVDVSARRPQPHAGAEQD